MPNTNYKSLFLFKKPVFNEFLKINQLLITFCLDLVCNKTLKARNSTPTYMKFLTFNIPIAH